MLRLTPEVLVELPGGLIAPGWLGLEAMTDDRFGSGRNGRVPAPHLRWPTAFRARVPQHVSERADQLRERMAPGQQLVENDPEAVKVASLVSRHVPVRNAANCSGAI